MKYSNFFTMSLIKLAEQSQLNCTRLSWISLMYNKKVTPKKISLAN